MFLSTPTIDELKKFELSVLIDMLVQQTNIYTKLLAKEGISLESNACLETIANIQCAIELKKNSNGASNNFTYSKNRTPYR